MAHSTDTDEFSNFFNFRLTLVSISNSNLKPTGHWPVGGGRQLGTTTAPPPRRCLAEHRVEAERLAGLPLVPSDGASTIPGDACGWADPAGRQGRADRYSRDSTARGPRVRPPHRRCGATQDRGRPAPHRESNGPRALQLSGMSSSAAEEELPREMVNLGKELQCPIWSDAPSYPPLKSLDAHGHPRRLGLP